MNEPVAWKAYDEVNFNDLYILRWVREGDEYVNRITCDMMEDLKSVVRQQQAEIKALKEQLHWLVQNPVKELTDEEIMEIALKVPRHPNSFELVKFAKAILRKASEK